MWLSIRKALTNHFGGKLKFLFTFNFFPSVIQEPNSPAGSPPHSPHGNGLDRAPTLRKELPGSSGTGDAPSTPNPRSPTPGKAKDPAQVGQTDSLSLSH